MNKTERMLRAALLFLGTPPNERITGSLAGETFGQRCIMGAAMVLGEKFRPHLGRGVIAWHYPEMLTEDVRCSENDAMLLTKLNDLIAPPQPYAWRIDRLFAGLEAMVRDQQAVEFDLDPGRHLWLNGIAYTGTVRLTPHSDRADYLSLSQVRS